MASSFAIEKAAQVWCRPNTEQKVVDIALTETFADVIDEVVGNPFEALKKALQEDFDYAWVWHCNIACAMMDAGGTHKMANKAAAIFMKNCFDIDTKDGEKRAFKKG